MVKTSESNIEIILSLLTKRGAPSHQPKEFRFEITMSFSVLISNRGEQALVWPEDHLVTAKNENYITSILAQTDCLFLSKDQIS